VDAARKRKLGQRENALHRHGSGHTSRNNGPAAAGLVTLLAENSTIGSASTIARRLRFAVDGMAAGGRLREWAEGEGRPATGYFLEPVPDILMPDMLSSG